VTARGHVPHRTCAGCRRKAPKRELTRLALAAGGEAVLDPAGRAGGRGAYVCSPACLDLARRRGGLARAFRARVTAAPDPSLLGADITH
jgi:predicted RNA-binding protein YlxR (DUF448 family)